MYCDLFIFVTCSIEKRIKISWIHKHFCSAYMNALDKSFSSLTLLFPIIVKIYSRSIHSSASIFSLPMHRCSLKERIILCEAHGDHDNRNTYSRNGVSPHRSVFMKDI